MSHIIADVILVALALFLVLLYTKRGFFKSIFGFAKFFIAMAIANAFGAKIGSLLFEKLIYTPVRGAVFSKVSGVFEEAAEAFSAERVISSMPGFLMTDSVQESVRTASGGGDELVSSMSDAIALPLSTAISNILGYILVFVVATLLLTVAAFFLNKIISALPIVGTVNRLLGLLLGLVVALATLFIVCSVLRVFFADDPFYTESAVIRLFGDSAVLRTISFLDVGSNVVERFLH